MEWQHSRASVLSSYTNGETSGHRVFLAAVDHVWKPRRLASRCCATADALVSADAPQATPHAPEPHAKKQCGTVNNGLR